MLDRMADSVHCLHFTGKYGCAVSTAGGAMADETADYMNSANADAWSNNGWHRGSQLHGKPRPALLPAGKKAKDLGRKLAEAIGTEWKDPAQQAYYADRKARMKQLVLANKDVWTHEFDHWKAMGWI